MSTATKEAAVIEDVLWREPQVTATLGISRTMLWKLETNGVLPAVRIGRSVRWKKSAVLGYIANLAAGQQTVGR